MLCAPVFLFSGLFLEVYAFTAHFPMKRGEHFPGCMPLFLYGKHDAPQNPLVSFHHYVVQTLCELESTRSADEKWIAYAFDTFLYQIVDQGTPFAVIKRGNGNGEFSITKRGGMRYFRAYFMTKMKQEDVLTSCVLQLKNFECPLIFAQ